MLVLNGCKKLILLYFFLSCYCIAIASNDTLNVKNYGAKGDGKTNDYQSILKAVTDINNRGGNCTLIFPAGNYLIDVHSTANEKYKDFEFDSCRNISIIGSSAIINLKGDYYRSADYVTGPKKITRSYTYSIIPFSFRNCNNVILSGFEVNGNSDKVSRDPKVVEGPSHLVRIWETENITVRNMYLHHGITDGICIGGKNKFSRNITFYNVISASNARQGMTIVGAREALFDKCRFINTGYYTGKYGHHAPSAGVDIEPIRLNLNGVKTGNIKFIDCKFENNLGGQIRNGHAISVDSVFFLRDTVIAGSSEKKYQLVLGCGYSEMDNCYIDIGNGIFFATSMRSANRQSSIINNCVINIGNNGQIISTKKPSSNATVRFTTNKIYCKTRTDKNTWFDFKYGDVKFLKNEVYFPKSYFDSTQKDVYIGKEKLNLNNAVKKMNN